MLSKVCRSSRKFSNLIPAKYNLNPGPGMLVNDVLKKAHSELLNYRNSGMSMIEMSHRQPEFAEITDKLQREMRKFMKVPDDWQIYLMQGGATLQFSGIPINLACHTYGTDAAVANYLITG